MQQQWTPVKGLNLWDRAACKKGEMWERAGISLVHTVQLRALFQLLVKLKRSEQITWLVTKYKSLEDRSDNNWRFSQCLISVVPVLSLDYRWFGVAVNPMKNFWLYDSSTLASVTSRLDANWSERYSNKIDGGHLLLLSFFVLLLMYSYA